MSPPSEMNRLQNAAAREHSFPQVSGGERARPISRHERRRDATDTPPPPAGQKPRAASAQAGSATVVAALAETGMAIVQCTPSSVSMYEVSALS